MSEATLHRGFVFRLHPTPAQAERLLSWCGAVRAVYNAALEQRRDFWRQYRRAEGRSISFASQSAEVKHLRAAFDWIADAPFCALDAALMDLDRAYAAFFAGRAKYPGFRSKRRHNSLRVRGSCAVRPLSRKWAEVRLPKVGWVKFRQSRPIRGELLSITISHRSGAWNAALMCEVEAATLAPLAVSVGIDRGIVQTLTLSTGETMLAPDTSRLLARQKRAQRVLARRRRGSKRYARQLAKVGGLSARMARIRADWSHRASTEIAGRFGMVAIEDLQIANMTASAAGTADAPGRNVRQKAGLNRSILEQCWGSFARNLDYKLTERGGVLIAVPPHHTSQTCSACGVIDARSRKSQAAFVCVHCGHADNADVNAAKAILRRSTSGLDVEARVATPTKRQPQENAYA